MIDRETQHRPGRPFHGWIMVAAAMAVYVVVSGSTFALSVFIKPMTADLGWGRADVTLGIGLVMITGSLLAVVTGPLTDRFGPRMIVFTGGLAYTAAFALAARVSAVWQFYASYGLLAGVGMGCMFVPLSSTILRWFVKKRGVAMGLFYAGGGLGGLVLTPVVQAIITRHGWRAGWATLAGVAAALILPAALCLRKDPQAVGLLPLGGSGEESGGGDAALPVLPGGLPREAAGGEDRSFGEAMRSASLWLFGLASLLTFSGVLLAQINLVAYATDRGIEAATAAAAMGLLAGVNGVGRLGMGVIADRLGVRLAMVGTAGLITVVLFYLNAVETAWMLFLFAIPFGFLAGGFLTMLPLGLARLFGTRALGSIMGVVGLFATIGPALSPAVGAAIYDRTGSYFHAFLLAGTCAGIAFVIFAAILPGPARHLEVSAPEPG